MNRPNIFKYAKKELSQDAFICWLVSWVNTCEDEALKNCSRAFVALLYNLYHKTEPISPESVISIPDGYPKNQYKRIDVFFRAIIRAKEIESEVAFIIEDKTDTTPHSDQLPRHIDVIKSEFSGEIVPVLFKTGYICPVDEKAIEESGYCLLGCETLHKFLMNFKISNEIFISYADYIESNRLIRQKQWSESFDRLIQFNETEHFKSSEVQCEYMKLVKRCCTEHIGVTGIELHKNQGGSPFTTYGFIFFNNIYTSCRYQHEHLYYRIDVRKNRSRQEYGYYISLIQYADIKNASDEEKQKKLERLRRYKQMFTSVLKEIVVLIHSSEVTTDLKGKNESEIGIWFFDKDRNTPNAILEDIPKFHSLFVRKVKEVFWNDGLK